MSEVAKEFQSLFLRGPEGEVYCVGLEDLGKFRLSEDASKEYREALFLLGPEKEVYRLALQDLEEFRLSAAATQRYLKIKGDLQPFAKCTTSVCKAMSECAECEVLP